MEYSLKDRIKESLEKIDKPITLNELTQSLQLEKESEIEDLEKCLNQYNEELNM